MARAGLRARLGALALAAGLLAGAVIAMLKGAWWVSLGCALFWLALEAGWLVRRRLRQHGGIRR